MSNTICPRCSEPVKEIQVKIYEGRYQTQYLQPDSDWKTHHCRIVCHHIGCNETATERRYAFGFIGMFCKPHASEYDKQDSSARENANKFKQAN